MYNGHVYHKITEQPIAGIKVSDGMHISVTDAKGAFVLPGWEKAHLISVQVLTKEHGDWFLLIEGHEGDYDFYIHPSYAEDAHCFLQVSDTEIGSDGCGKWLDFAKACVWQQDAAFLIHTGDICRKDGLEAHWKDMNAHTMGCPVRYTLGNHDYVDETYGEYTFERLYGPTWYSFDVGNIHYVILPMIEGDAPGIYEPQDSLRWLENDLAFLGEHQKVVVFSHDLCYMDEDGFVLNVDGRALELKKHGLLAWVFGHYHEHFCNDFGGYYNIATGRPDCGGIDSSPAAIRKISVSGEGKLATELLYNRSECTQQAECYEWQINVSGRVQFANPIVEGHRLFVATSDDGHPMECGVFCVDLSSGEILWQYRTKGSIKNNHAFENGKVFAQDHMGTVYCLDAETGNLIWEKDIPCERHYVVSGVTTADGKVFCGNRKQVFALSQDTGEEVWHTEPILAGNTDGPARFVCYAGKLICSSQWSSIYAVDMDTGRVLWENKEAFYHTSTPTIFGNQLYYTSTDRIYCLDLETGRTLQTESLGNGVDLNTVSQIVFEGKEVYISTARQGVLAFTKEEWKPLRQYPCGEAIIIAAPYVESGNHEVQGTPVIEGAYIFFAASDGYLHIYHRNTATECQKIYIGAPSYISPIVLKKQIITADFDGKVTSFSRI